MSFVLFGRSMTPRALPSMHAPLHSISRPARYGHRRGAKLREHGAHSNGQQLLGRLRGGRRTQCRDGQTDVAPAALGCAAALAAAAFGRLAADL